MRPLIAVVTSGHLATCPRMVKAADALHTAGYDVHVISCVFEPWAEAADRELAREPWEWSTVRYDAGAARTTYIASGIRRRAGRVLAAACGPDRIPFDVATRAFSRVHSEIVDRIVAARPAFVYAGTAGALAAAADAADRLSVPYGLDLEDFHSAEHDVGAKTLDGRLARRIEQRVLAAASMLTTASAPMADAYAREYGVQPIPVHNTFSLPAGHRTTERTPALRLYWFSQTIGPTRGLEDAIDAAGLLATPIELHLRGKARPGYVDALRQRQRAIARNLSLVVHPPASPTEMIDLCASVDVGLSGEQPTTRNRELCLGNKIFTYLASGRPVVLTDTVAHRMLAADIADAALLYQSGDAAGLAEGLSRWISNRQCLAAAQNAAWNAARRRWHWEHPLDRGALLASVSRVSSARPRG